MNVLVHFYREAVIGQKYRTKFPPKGFKTSTSVSNCCKPSKSCQSRLLLFSAQISNLNSQGLNLERKGANLKSAP